MKIHRCQESLEFLHCGSLGETLHCCNLVLERCYATGSEIQYLELQWLGADRDLNLQLYLYLYSLENLCHHNLKTSVDLNKWLNT